MSREIIETVRRCGRGSTVAFMDGSCMGNPGPCGSGACVYLPSVVDPVRLKRPVCKRGIHPFGGAGCNTYGLAISYQSQERPD